MGNKSNLTDTERSIIQSEGTGDLTVRSHQLYTGSRGHDAFQRAIDDYVESTNSVNDNTTPVYYTWPIMRTRTITFESKWDDVYKELFGSVQMKLNKNTKVI